MKDTVAQAAESGVRCVTGEVAVGLRSQLKFIGNTVDQDHFSVGKAYQQYCASGGGGKKDEHGNWIEGTHEHPQYALLPFKAADRVDLGQRQAGIAEQSYMMELRRDSLLDFCIEYNWAEDDINYYAAIQLFLECAECESERVLYAAAKVHWNDVFKIHDSHVPLNPGLYADKKKHCGWNILSLNSVQYAQGTANITRALGFDGSMLIVKKHQEDAN